jgi:hypothetical protein
MMAIERCLGSEQLRLDRACSLLLLLLRLGLRLLLGRVVVVVVVMRKLLLDSRMRVLLLAILLSTKIGGHEVLSRDYHGQLPKSSL